LNQFTYEKGFKRGKQQGYFNGYQDGIKKATLKTVIYYNLYRFSVIFMKYIKRKMAG